MSEQALPRRELFCVRRGFARVEIYKPVEHVHDLRVGETIIRGVWQLCVIRGSDGGPSCPVYDLDCEKIYGTAYTEYTVTDGENRMCGDFPLPPYKPGSVRAPYVHRFANMGVNAEPVEVVNGAFSAVGG